MTKIVLALHVFEWLRQDTFLNDPVSVCFPKPEKMNTNNSINTVIICVIIFLTCIKYGQRHLLSSMEQNDSSAYVQMMVLLAFHNILGVTDVGYVLGTKCFPRCDITNLISSSCISGPVNPIGKE